MNYYFIKYASKESLIKGLKSRNLLETVQGEEIPVKGTSIEYVGDIPLKRDEEGNVTEWAGGFHANIVTDQTLTFGANERKPKTPSRIFGGWPTPQEPIDIVE